MNHPSVSRGNHPLLSLVLKIEHPALLSRIIGVRRITILRASGLLPALHL